MKTTPLLFNSDMVRALLDGRKTMTRRIVKNWPMTDDHDCQECDKHFNHIDDPDFIDSCPYGKKGDLIWVRENIWVDRREPKECCIYDATPNKYKYKGGKFGACTEGENFLTEKASLDGLITHKHWYKKPSIHMHKYFSRLTLKITDVRVERVQDITYNDVIHEGVGRLLDEQQTDQEHKTHTINQFKELWQSINKNWDANPWVWVISFEVINKNIDEYLTEQQKAI